MHRTERFGMLRCVIAFAMSLVLVVGGLPTSAMAEGLAGGSAVAVTSTVTTQDADTQGGTDASRGDDTAATGDAPDAVAPTTATASEAAATSEVTTSDESAASAATVPTDADATTVASDSQTITVKASVLVPATTAGTFAAWAAEGSYQVESGTTTDVLTEKMLKAEGLAHESSDTSYGYLLSTITSPDGATTLGYDQDTGRYWQLFVNGKSSDLGASSVHLSAGDTIFWVYSAYGETLPANPVTVSPDSSHEDVGSDWPGFKGTDQSGVVGGLATPTTTTDLSWAAKLKETSDWATSVSDPVIVGGDVWVAVGDKLLVLSSDTGAIKYSVPLVSKIDSTARMVYSDGLVVVPLFEGRLQAVSAQTHETVWATDALAKTGQTDQQSLSTLVVDGGKVFMGTAAAGWSASFGGHLFCVDLATGSLLWDKVNDKTGYYWSGAAIHNGVGLIADDSGTLTTFSTTTGETIKTASLGTSVRSTVVMAADGIHAFVMSKDGTLHRMAMGADGSLVEEASVSLGSSSTSTPVLVGDKLIVGGSSKNGKANKWGTVYYGALFVVNAQTLEVEASIDTCSDGSWLPADVKSTPLVSTRSDGTFVYFTCNTTPGGVYLYKVGDTAATLLFEPTGDLANYCMASVTCDGTGALYYVNDSGHLMKLTAGTADSSTDKGDGDGTDADGSSDADNVSNGSDASATSGGVAASPTGQAVASNAEEPALATQTDLAAEPEVTSIGDDATPTSLGVTTDQATAQTIPLWPIVGICLGLAALVGILVWARRRKQDEK